jgi:hypothetical protein
MLEIMKGLGRSAGAKWVAVMATLFGVLSLSAPSFATGDPVADGFTSGQTSITTYIGLGVGVIAAIVVLGIGVVVLVKYLRKAGRAA